MRGELAILNQTQGKCKEVFVRLYYDSNAGEEVPEIPPQTASYRTCREYAWFSL